MKAAGANALGAGVAIYQIYTAKTHLDNLFNQIVQARDQLVS